MNSSWRNRISLPLNTIDLFNCKTRWKCNVTVRNVLQNMQIYPTTPLLRDLLNKANFFQWQLWRKIFGLKSPAVKCDCTRGSWLYSPVSILIATRNYCKHMKMRFFTKLRFLLRTMPAISRQIGAGFGLSCLKSKQTAAIETPLTPPIFLDDP